jgi:hypothetical protein
MPKLTRNGTQVELTQPGMKVSFSTLHGGAPLNVINTKLNIPVVSNHPGEGWQVVWDSGQDGTQASATGVDGYPIHTLGTSGDEYYAREEAFLPDKDGHEALYQVGGPAPYFWISQEAIDDCIPPHPSGKPSGWCTPYNNFINLPASSFNTFGTPIYFAPRGEVKSGIILLGDEIAGTYNSALPWNLRVATIEGGKLAFKIRIDLSEAPPDVIAGVYFRKPDLYSATDTQDAVYNAPGSTIYINKAGGVDYFDNKKVFHVRSSSPSQQLTLEVRSSLTSSDIQIFIDGTFCGTFPSSYAGGAIGLYCQCSSGKVKFDNRNIFDIGTNLTAQYRSTSRDTLWQALTVSRVCAPYYAPMYRLNLPVCFIDPSIREQFRTWNFAGGCSIVDSDSSGIFPLSQVKAFYAGRKDGKAGMFCRIHSYTGQSGHIGISRNNAAISALSFNANFSPEMMTAHAVISEWCAEIREDLL